MSCLEMFSASLIASSIGLIFGFQLRCILIHILMLSVFNATQIEVLIAGEPPKPRFGKVRQLARSRFAPTKTRAGNDVA